MTAPGPGILARLRPAPPCAPAGASALYQRPGQGVSATPSGDGWQLAPGAQLSLDTYVNGLPTGEWSRLAGEATLFLHATIDGHATLTVHSAPAPPPLEQSGGNGAFAMSGGGGERGEPVSVTAEGGIVSLPLGSAPWSWLTVRAHGSVTVRDVRVETLTPVRPARLGCAVTTLDRPDGCSALVAALAELDPQDVPLVVVVDHGATPWLEHPGARAAQDLLGERLVVLPMPNLGGSSGFSRGMARLLQEPGITHIALLDDDIVLDPEVLRRAHALAALGADGLLGTHMLHAREPGTVLHTTGERVIEPAFIWRTPQAGAAGLDLASAPMSGLPQVWGQGRPDFTGWWCCVVPSALLRDTGLAMPYFIKWDDVELGLRAKALGRPTMLVPGLGVWHVPWTAKDTSVDWQVYHLTRNRLVTAAVHGLARPERMLAGIGAHALMHVGAMAYGAAELVIAGLEAFLAGPDALVRDQEKGLQHVVERQRRVQHGSLRGADTSRFPVVPLAQASARRLAPLPGVRVVLSDGTSVSARRRDLPLAARQTARIAALTAQVAVRWPVLRRRYARAAPQLRSPKSWERIWERALTG